MLKDIANQLECLRGGGICCAWNHSFQLLSNKVDFLKSHNYDLSHNDLLPQNLDFYLIISTTYLKIMAFLSHSHILHHNINFYLIIRTFSTHYILQFSSLSYNSHFYPYYFQEVKYMHFH